MTNFNPNEYINGLCDNDGQEIGCADTNVCDVTNPSHYTVGGYEAIDIIQAKLTPEEFRGFLKGNVLKYLMRANYKGHHDKDCRKAEWYSVRLIKTLKHGEVQHGTTEDGDIPF